MNEQPTPEQFLIREAAKRLTAKQTIIWELHNYEQLSNVDIAHKLSVSPQGIGRHLKAIERKIKKFVKSNLAGYNLLKMETQPNE